MARSACARTCRPGTGAAPRTAARTKSRWQGIHQTRNGRTLLRHRDKNLARRAVLVHPDRDVAFVARDIEFVGEGLALIGQLAPREALIGHGRRYRCAEHLAWRAIFFPAGIEWLGALGAVAINRDRLESELPG